MKNSLALSTVNIIESIDGRIQQLKSFPDDEKGNLAAENLFIKLIKENDAEDRQNFLGIDYYLDEGVYNNFDYYLYIVHSN
jgi:hypothetical protein